MEAAKANMADMPRPLAHLADAAILLALLVCVLAGVRLEWVFGVYLALEILTKLAKAITAFVDPIVKAASAHGPS